MESRDWWVDVEYDGESKQEKCRCAGQTDGWSLAGLKLPKPLPQKCVVPLKSPEDCFHAPTKAV